MAPPKKTKAAPPPVVPEPEQPKAKPIAAKKGRPVVDIDGEKRKKKAKRMSFKVYIFKVLKQVHQDMGISSKGMEIMNSIVFDTFEKLAAECAQLTTINKRSTISAREVQTASRFIFPGELSKHAISEGSKAVATFSRFAK